MRKTHITYLSVVAFIMCLFFIQQCQNRKHESDLINNISTYSDSAKHYKDKLGNLVAYNQTLQFNNEAQLKSYLSKNDSMALLLKKFKDITSVSGTTYLFNQR